MSRRQDLQPRQDYGRLTGRRLADGHVLHFARPKGGGEQALVALTHPAREKACPLEAALQLGEDFLDFEPERVRVASFRRPPAVLTTIGPLLTVEYSSAKFDGELRHYRHEFEDDPPILAVHPDGWPLYVIGGTYHVDDRGIVG